ncbi:MAG TPA: LPS export ABC transporter periplasmic protein LptC [Gammaproteobacteria bacterium]|nr:LPS export ABC transporter periplasmic protein LptC [Gammaproteobacteria bacterium]
MRNTIVMVVLAIVAAATWILTWQRQDEAPPVERIGDAEPLGYYARGARISGTDEQGRLSYRIFADRLDELPGEELLELTGVKVDYQPADETAWTLTAASGTYAWDGSLLDLNGDVEARSMPADGSRALTMTTQKMVFSPDTSSAASDGEVAIRVGDWQLSAVGLRADLKGDTLALESEVHGTILP